MEPTRRVFSPAFAISCAALAVALLAGAFVWRSWRAEPAEPQVCVLPGPAPAGSGADPSQASSHTPVAPISPLVASPPPGVGRVSADVAAADRGVVVTLRVELHVPATVPRDLLTVRVQCAIDGEWYDGSGSILLDRLGSGDHVVVQKIDVGYRYKLGTLPTACHLRFEHLTTPVAKLADRVIAIRCWNGHDVVDGRCAPVDHAPPSFVLDDVHVSDSLDTFRTAVSGTPSSLRVDIDAELTRALDGWSWQVAADCTLPGGTRSDRAHSPLGFTRPGKPFSDHVSLFFDAKLPDVPTACTLRFELSDLYDLAHEPIAVRCWKSGKTVPGACA